MKKWLGEASSLCGHQNKNSEDDSSSPENSRKLQQCSKTDKRLSHCSSSVPLVDMGLGVSSEALPQTSLQNYRSEEVSDINTHRRCSGELSLHRPSVSFITSAGSRIQVSSPCHHFPASTLSVQIHHPTSTCSTSSQTHRLMSLVTSGAGSIPHESPVPEHHSCSSASAYQLLEADINSLTSHESSSVQTTFASQSLALSLASLQPSNEGTSSHAHVSIDHILPSTSSQLASSSAENQAAESSSESDLHLESATSACNSGLYGQHSEFDYDVTALVPTSQTFRQIPDHLPGSASHTAGGVGTSVCGHWCSACRVKVQVEVECVASSQRSPNGNRRGIRTLSFPKRTRHKTKAPTKDLNANHKKKKSPWSFRLNCRLRPNKNEGDQESALSSLNIACASCVCRGYRRPETEAVYRSVGDSGSTSNLTIHTPVVDFSRLSPETCSANDGEEDARQERAREMAEGIDPPPGFMPLLRDSQNSLALPLTYKSMLDLQVLFESSLRLGLGGPRNSPGPSYAGESLLGAFSTDGSLLSRTVHTQVDYIHCLVPDLLAITNCGFYWGKMDRYEAERLLENRADGTFLLRDSAQEEYLFSVSFRRYGRSLHARIEQWNHKFSFDSHDPGVFASDTVCDLIEHYKDPSCCMFFEPLLTNPLARTFPFPLVHLCRATICSTTTYDGISNLELPKTLKNYLKEYHYKQRVRVRHLD